MNGIYALKPWFVGRLRFAEDHLVAHRVSPNAVTLTAFLVSAAAAAAVVGGALLGQPLLWLALLPLGVTRLALNALDGSVARRLDLSTPRGAALNELGDRACDLILMTSLMVVAPAWLVIAAIAAMTLTSTAGVMALAITGRRDTAGPMGKADRVLLLGFAGLVSATLGSYDPFVISLIAVISGCLVTTWLRIGRIPKEVGDVR